MIQISSLVIFILIFCAKTVFSDTICANHSKEFETQYHIKIFTENNTRKAFIYPIKTEKTVSRDNSGDLCSKLNATLVGIETYEKQLLVQSYLDQFNGTSYWTDGYFDGLIDHVATFKWFNSGIKFNYTNWASMEPISVQYHGDQPLFTMIGYTAGRNDTGKWYTQYGAWALNDVFCEMTLKC